MIKREEGGQEKVISALTSMAAMGLASGAVTFASGGVVNPLTARLTTAGAGMFANVLAQNIVPRVKDELFNEYKKFVDAGKNPVEAMSSAMDFVTHDPENTLYVQTEPKVLLGCKFKDANEFSYELQKYTYGKRSKWADEELPPMIFKTGDDFDKFKVDLDNICSSVIESTTYNDVDQLIR